MVDPLTCLPEELRHEAVLSYAVGQHNMKAVLQQIFECEQLDLLHEQEEGCTEKGYVSFSNDQGTAFHKRFYASPHFPAFLRCYTAFVHDVIAPMFAKFGESEIVFQTRPTFRVSLPNNVAVGQKHRDYDYQHPAGEVNFWLPFTPAHDTSGFYTESEPEKGDFHPFPRTLDAGDMFRFWGNQCWHYNELNATGRTRVSVDLRVIPRSIFVGREEAAVKSKLKFDIGGYYSVCPVPNVQSA